MNKKTKELYAIAKRSGDWSIYLMGFSPQEALILKAIADTPKTVDEVVRKIIQPPASVKSAVTLLLSHQILTKPDPKRYAVANAKFAAYLATTKIVLDKEEVADIVFSVAYNTVLPFFDGLEENGFIDKDEESDAEWNATLIAAYAKTFVLEKWKKS